MLLLPLFLDWVEDRLLINLDCLLGGREFSRFNPHLLVRYLTDLLESLSTRIKIITARNGFDAGQKVMQFNPQIVLLDLMMPGLSGFEVCRYLRENPLTAKCKIIAMTGYYTRKNIDGILEAGADTCIAKPIERDKLLAALQLEG